MTILLDILGALFVRSAIVTIILTVTASLNDALYFKVAYKNLQADLTSTVEVVEADFLKIGYNVYGAENEILIAGPDSVAFLTDYGNDGLPDTILYYLGNVGELSVTPNPYDKYLYRRVSSLDGGQPLIVGASVTKFKLLYYNAEGGLEVDPSLVVSVNVEMTMQHPTYMMNDDPSDPRYPYTTWQRRIYPVNR